MWVRSVLKSSGVPYFSGPAHVPPHNFLPVLPDRFAFTFVRHPVTWWRSFWAYSEMNGWPSSHEPFERITRVCLWHSYEAFMERVLNDMPGEYSRIVAWWTEDMHRVGRFENLAADLTSILDEAGCPLPGPVDEPPVNVGTYSEASKTTPEIDAEIMRTEEYVIAEYYGSA
jgi:hypothetical protein